MERIRSFRKYELEIETKRGQLSTIRLDASSLEGIKQLKGSCKYFHEMKPIKSFFSFFKIFVGHLSICGATVLDFWGRLLWVSWVLPYSNYAEAYVIYVP